MKLISIGKSTATTVNSTNTWCIGIDLGTTNSVIAVSTNQQASVLPIRGNLVPSVLKKDLSLAPSLEYGDFHDFKKFMEEPEQTIFSQYSAIDLSAVLLQHLKTLTEKFLKKTVSDVVITVPARFSNIARKSTKIAAKKAGLNVIRLLNEPTAAAIAYGLNNTANGIFLVYDFGGGTFDVTVLRIQNDVFQVLATTGDLNLGGNNIDIDIAQYLGDDNNDPYYLQKAKTIKESYNNSSDSVTAFDAIIDKYVQRTMQIVKNALAFSHLNESDITGVILTGGSTRLKRVTHYLDIMFGHDKILRSVDPDMAVAIGAALHGEVLTNNTMSSRPLLLDIVPASLGIETVMGYVENIIPKYTPTPICVNTQFSTMYDNQTEIFIHIVQGDDAKVGNCRSLSKFILRNIPPMPKGQPQLNVMFNVDEDGVLIVSANESISGIHKTVTLESYV
ncbi:MAG: Hsp70 family protein [Holosporales bacterium]|jgi:molecular chaperone HscA|nr:Hsp70 family protein [Holosporales bacterium]